MFGELGFHGLKVQGLAERCGLSGAGLLYYFKSKEELLLAVLDEISQREMEQVMPALHAVEAEGDLSQAWSSLVELLRQMFRHSLRNPEVARFVLLLQVESLDQGHVAHDWFRDREQQALDLITALLTPHVAEPVSNSRHIKSMMLGLGQQWIRQDMKFDVCAEWDKVLELVLSRGRLMSS